jgi:hypothetical protein
VTPCAVATVLEMRATDIEAIANGQIDIGKTSWAKIAAMVERGTS